MAWPVPPSSRGADRDDAWNDSAGDAALPESNVAWSAVADGVEHPFGAAERERYRDPLVMAAGGMGRVSAVTDRRLRREVALKEVRPDEPGAAGLEQRLAQEAWITAQLEHPGIVPVHDAGRNERGRLFFTMRLIRGRSLSAALAATERDEGDLLRHFLTVCQAMAYAHSRGVVHRDLKPANIMIGAFGETQIVDWGVARTLDAEPPAAYRAAADRADADAGRGLARAEPDVRTAFGARIGTPAYMSPEQARAEPAGRASDVWSLGAILFEIIARRPLCAGLTTAEMSSKLTAISKKP